MTMAHTESTIFDNRPCTLGEGPLWHPLRRQFFWFDILGNRLLSRENNQPRVWQFEENVSAAGWTGQDTLLIASETALFHFNLETEKQEILTPLEADSAHTRSNDGRADPWGGFWIGTMGKNSDPGAGAIYRWYQGELRQLRAQVTVPNAICFAPGGACAYFADTSARQIMRQALDDNGWPIGAAAVFLDLRAEGLKPDGAVIDSEGCMWNAQWGASRVARYDAAGTFMAAVSFPARNTSCPAFGGDTMQTLLMTSARQKLDLPTDHDGLTYVVDVKAKGQLETRVLV